MPGEGFSAPGTTMKQGGNAAPGAGAFNQPALANATRGGGPFRRMAVGAGFKGPGKPNNSAVMGGAHNAARRRKGANQAVPTQPGGPGRPF